MSPDVASIASRILVGWARRYARAAGVVAALTVVVALMPSTIPLPATPLVPRPATVVPIATPTLPSTAPPTTAAPGVARLITPLLAPAPLAGLPAAAPTTSSTPPVAAGHPPPPVTPPPPPAAVSTCPVDLPAAQSGPSANPILLDFLPLAGPFGPEALAFLPVLGPLLPALTPLLPALSPTLQAAQPAIAQAVSGAVLVEQAVTGPFGTEITSFTPQALSGEKEVVALLQPVTTAVAGTPIVACVYQLTSVVGAAFVRSQS